MQEKYNLKDAAQFPPPDSPTSDAKLCGLPTHKSYHVIGDQDPEIKRIVTYRGRLSVKVRGVAASSLARMCSNGYFRMLEGVWTPCCPLSQLPVP